MEWVRSTTDPNAVQRRPRRTTHGSAPRGIPREQRNAAFLGSLRPSGCGRSTRSRIHQRGVGSPEMSIGAEFGDLIGSTLAGRYRILERLGEGGMATVFAAHHVTLDAKVAVKVLHPNLARDARQRKRFVREARSANRIVHEHVVNIFDFAE